MRKSLMFIIGLALVAIIVGASGCTWSPSPESGSPGFVPDTDIILSQQNTGIWVTGEGKVTVVPDVAILSLGVEAQAATVSEAQAEGVEINYLAMPVRIAEKDGEIRGLECIKTRLGEPDESGRRRPMPIEGSEFILETSSIISAVGQRPDLSWNQEGLPFNVSPMNTFIVDDSCLTNIEGVFAAGDALNGPTTVVEAMASGKRAASSVDRYLSGNEQEKS